MTKTQAPTIERVHFMADIETLGTGHRPVITSIGVVAFSAASGILGRLYLGVDIGSCMRRGAHIDPSTLLWWLHPKRDAARAEWVTMPAVEIDDALDALVSWTSQWDGVVKHLEFDPEVDVPVTDAEPIFQHAKLWGKGSTFDCVHLRDAALYTGVDWPFGFRDEACYRTAADAFPEVKATPIENAHSAIADAEGQALHLLAISYQTGFYL